VAAVSEPQKSVGCDRIITKPLCGYGVLIQNAIRETIYGTLSCPSSYAQVLILRLPEHYVFSGIRRRVAVQSVPGVSRHRSDFNFKVINAQEESYVYGAVHHLDN